jgi:hypothetical protein
MKGWFQDNFKQIGYQDATVKVCHISIPDPKTCDLESKDQIIAFKGFEPNLRGQNPLNLRN